MTHIVSSSNRLWGCYILGRNVSFLIFQKSLLFLAGSNIKIIWTHYLITGNQIALQTGFEPAYYLIHIKCTFLACTCRNHYEKEALTCLQNVPYYAAIATIVIGLNAITFPVTNWLLPILLSLCAIKSKSPPIIMCTMLHELLGTPFNWAY